MPLASPNAVIAPIRPAFGSVEPDLLETNLIICIHPRARRDCFVIISWP